MADKEVTPSATPPTSTELPPASQPFPGSRTPGWNDPPTLQYNPLAAGATGNRTRLNLNKRVAFPLQGTAGGDAAQLATKPTAIVPPNQASSMLPPPPVVGTQPIAVVHPMPAPPYMPRVPPTPVTAEGSAAGNNRAVGPVIVPVDAEEYALRVLHEQASLVQESLNVRREEIDRRLGILAQLWQSGNLSAAMQEKVYRLAKAITERKFNEAMEIHTALVANHSNECTTWAVALRHIVLTLQATNGDNGDEDVPEYTSATIAFNSESSNIAVIPPVLVPAMARQAAAPASTNANNDATHLTANSSSVQHI